VARAKAPTRELTARVRHLISLDASRLMKRLVSRQDEMVSLFSRLRDRAPMLEACRSWFPTATFADLVALSPEEQAAVSDFYEQVGELRWYAQYTEEMPGQVQQRVAQFVRGLSDAHRVLVWAIGPPEARGEPVVEVKRVKRLRLSSK
jgi:hypothetical protein